MNGEALRPEQGYPLRAVIPGWEGNLWVKWLRRIEVGDKPWQTREETSKYTDLLADGRSRRLTFVMDAKSVVTNPSPQAPLKHKGRNVLSGIAWSGRGTIKRVDVTLDGGRNWHTARIDGPVLDKSLTRFYVDFDWNGQELMIQSRAMDSTGYVQPTKEELRKISRRQFDLPQQRHSDLAGPAERRHRECRNRLGLAASMRTRGVLAAFVAVVERLGRGSQRQSLSAANAPLGLGRAALPEEIKAWDTDVRLRTAQGCRRARGRSSRAISCIRSAAQPAMASSAKVRDAGRSLAGGHGTLKADRPDKTIGSFWPYLSTVFDYMGRAMPYGNRSR